MAARVVSLLRQVAPTSRYHPKCLLHLHITQMNCSRVAAMHSRVPQTVLKTVQCTFPLRQSSRSYSSENNEDNPLKVTGKVVRLRNPFMVLYEKWQLYKIRQEIDAKFNLAEFSEGAKQAACFFTQHLSDGQFDELLDVTTNEVISDVRERLTDFDASITTDLAVTAEEIHFTDATVHSCQTEQDDTTLSMDVFFVAVKTHAASPSAIMLEISLRFQRDYQPKSSSDWMISRLNHFNVREIDLPSQS